MARPAQPAGRPERTAYFMLPLLLLVDPFQVLHFTICILRFGYASPMQQEPNFRATGLKFPCKFRLPPVTSAVTLSFEIKDYPRPKSLARKFCCAAASFFLPPSSFEKQKPLLSLASVVERRAPSGPAATIRGHGRATHTQHDTQHPTWPLPICKFCEVCISACRGF